VRHLFATVQDITERIRSEQALRERQAQLIEAQRIGRMGSWVLDLRTHKFSGSQETFRIHEVDPATFDLRSESFITLVHPDDRERLRATYWRSVARAEPEAQWHTVVRGDTLSAIAKKFYGDANKYPVIFEANKPMLSHPDKIYPGQMLRIPPQG